MSTSLMNGARAGWLTGGKQSRKSCSNRDAFFQADTRSPHRARLPPPLPRRLCAACAGVRRVAVFRGGGVLLSVAPVHSAAGAELAKRPAAKTAGEKCQAPPSRPVGPPREGPEQMERNLRDPSKCAAERTTPHGNQDGATRKWVFPLARRRPAASWRNQPGPARRNERGGAAHADACPTTRNITITCARHAPCAPGPASRQKTHQR